MFGMSINLITLFALVLAIGIVVDDAIVVVEAVHSNMEKDPKLSALCGDAKSHGRTGKRYSGHHTGDDFGVCADSLHSRPPVGVFYRQFSITMSSAIVISAWWR